MERLTPRAELAYPVERTIMETGSESTSQKKAVKKTPEARMAEIVSKFNQKERDKKQSQTKKDKTEDVRVSGGAGGGGFDKFDPDRFKDNSSLEELAKQIRAASRQGKLDAQFLEDIKSQLDRRTQLGLVSDNWNRNFTDYLNEFIVLENLSEAKGEDKELSQDIEAIVAQRKTNGLTAEQVQASRAAMELAFGRKLTETELQRATLGTESMKGKTSEAFELQMRSVESLIDNPKKYEAFLKTLSTQSPEVIKKALSGPEGKLVLGVLLGDVTEHEKFFAKLDEILKKDARGVRDSLPGLVSEIRRQAEEERVKEDPVLAKKQKEEFDRRVEEAKRRIREGVEVGGGADVRGHVQGLIEEIDGLPEEVNEIFYGEKSRMLDKGGEIVDLRLGEIFGEDKESIVAKKQLWLEIGEIGDPQEFKRRAKEFLEDLNSREITEHTVEALEKQEKEVKGKTGELIRTGRVEGKGRSFDIRGMEDIIKNISPNEDERQFLGREPKNIRELAVWIMASDDKAVWGPDGVYPLFTISNEADPNTGKKIINLEENNLIRWLRSKALEHHNDNPNDPISPLQSITIETLFRSVSILQMKYNKQKYFQDEDGRLLRNLAGEVVDEAWLFGVRRNKNLAYIQSMWSDEKLFEAMVEMNGKNEHTSGNNLENLLRMGEKFTEEKKNIDNRVGDAMLAISQIYRNIDDTDKLRQILPEDSPIFTLKGFKNAARVLNGQDFSDKPSSCGNLIIEGEEGKETIYSKNPRTGIRNIIFENGEYKGDKNLANFLNFFPAANPEESNELFVRELAKQTAAKLVAFDTGGDMKEYEKFKSTHGDISVEDYRRIARINLEWAEVHAWSEQRWNGAASRSDTGFRGYDAWTKMYIQYYRERQSGPRTAGPIGNPHDLQIFRMLSPDMWLAIRTESGQSVQEVFEEINKKNLPYYKVYREYKPLEEELEDLKKRNENKERQRELEEKMKPLKEEMDVMNRQKDVIYKKLKFPRWTELDWASNGLRRQSEVWHNILNTEDLKFSELVKRDNWGVLRYDRQKFEEVVKDDFIKKRRYALSSNNAMNYGAMTRMKVRAVNPKDIKDKDYFEYKDMTLAEAMFGDVVIKSIKDDWYNGKLDFEGSDSQGIKVEEKRAPKKGEEFNPDIHGTWSEYLNSAKGREKILKNVCRAGLAAQLKAHREHFGTTERWDSEMTRNFLRSLRSMPRYREDPLTGKEERIDGEQFFSEEDIEWIRKRTGTTRGRLIFEDSYHIGWDFLAEGVPDIMKMFYQSVVSE